MFEAILPTLSLDITDLLDDSEDNFPRFVSISCCFFFCFCSFPVSLSERVYTCSPETVQHLSDCG